MKIRNGKVAKCGNTAGNSNWYASEISSILTNIKAGEAECATTDIENGDKCTRCTEFY